MPGVIFKVDNWRRNGSEKKKVHYDASQTERLYVSKKKREEDFQAFKVASMLLSNNSKTT